MVIGFKVVAIVPVEAITGSEPHKTFTILENAVYRVLGKSIIAGQMLEGYLFISLGYEKEREQV